MNDRIVSVGTFGIPDANTDSPLTDPYFEDPSLCKVQADEGDKLSKGAIAGIVIGVLIGVALSESLFRTPWNK